MKKMVYFWSDQNVHSKYFNYIGDFPMYKITFKMVETL